MLTQRESIIDDYTKRGLSYEVKKLVNKRLTWIVLLIAMMSVMYFVFALWIFVEVRSAVQDTFETNKLKRKVALMELETDSLKRIKTDSLMRKYDKTVIEWKSQRKTH
jgi:hypothetical protein